MQHTQRPVNASPHTDDDEDAIAAQAAPERMAAVWAHRFTGMVGLVSLILALVLWGTRPEHLRPVLALLVIAMFCAVLHSYTFGDGRSG